MKSKKTINSLYSFPGFRAMATLKGIMGDPSARIIRLKRVQKKRIVPVVEKAQLPIMTARSKRFGIYLQEEHESFWSSNNTEYIAKNVSL